MKLPALIWLNKQVRKARWDKAHAEERPNSSSEEVQNLKTKIDILEYIIGVITAKGD